jgi:hypothetical protein
MANMSPHVRMTWDELIVEWRRETSLTRKGEEVPDDQAPCQNTSSSSSSVQDDGNENLSHP